MTARLLLTCALLPAIAGAGSSADYTLEPVATATGGLSGGSADYVLTSCTTHGGHGASADYTARTGFAGQLGAVVGLSVSASSLTLEETATGQLSAELDYDDGSHSPLPDLDWSVQSGPVASISASGIATPAPVYQNTSAVVRGESGGLSDELTIIVLDSLPDNFGTYAADALPDSWQIQYFGIGAPLAGKFDDFDGDDVSNLIEYAGGTHPASTASGQQPLVYQGNVIVPGKPFIEHVPAPNVLPHRVVFIRRKNAPGLSYVPQFSRNLATWAGATTPLVVLADDGVYQVVSHRFPVTINGLRSASKYFRLHFTATP